MEKIESNYCIYHTDKDILSITLFTKRPRVTPATEILVKDVTITVNNNLINIKGEMFVYDFIDDFISTEVELTPRLEEVYDIPFRYRREIKNWLWFGKEKTKIRGGWYHKKKTKKFYKTATNWMISIGDSDES